MPRAWAKAIASQTFSRISRWRSSAYACARSSSATVRGCSRVRQLTPSTFFITSSSAPPALVARSWTGTMFGCSRNAVTTASARNFATAVSLVPSRIRVFTATTRSSARCRDANTAPMPPRPSSSRRSYPRPIEASPRGRRTSATGRVSAGSTGAVAVAVKEGSAPAGRSCPIGVSPARPLAPGPCARCRSWADGCPDRCRLRQRGQRCTAAAGSSQRKWQFRHSKAVTAMKRA
jgi:hypothetical protein